MTLPCLYMVQRDSDLSRDKISTGQVIGSSLFSYHNISLESAFPLLHYFFYFIDDRLHNDTSLFFDNEIEDIVAWRFGKVNHGQKCTVLVCH